jgi:Macroglobulin domain MG3/Macroglobulin domain MG4
MIDIFTLFYQQKFSKSIEVQEYTLPAFSASVSAPVKVAFADGHVPITVGAQYTFGQKVEGSAVVTFKQWGYQILYERSVTINASSITFDVDFTKDLKIDQIYYDQSILVEVQFTDKQTGQLAAASTEFTLVQFRHTIVFQGAPNFKPGLPYVFKVTVKKLDGSPAAENSNILIQTVFNGESIFNQTFTLDSAGSVDLESDVPLNATYAEFIVCWLKKRLLAYKMTCSFRLPTLTQNSRITSMQHRRIKKSFCPSIF